MTGKILALIIALSALVAGGALYYLQIYGFYYPVTPTPGQDVMLISRDSGQPVPIAYDSYQAIDADSSPIRYRACFTTPMALPDLIQGYETRDGGEPRTAPGWFDCFDAEAVGDALAAGELQMFIAQKNIAFGIDRVAAIGADGRGWVWHELNNCGEKAYDGTIVGEECPPRP